MDSQFQLWNIPIWAGSFDQAINRLLQITKMGSGAVIHFVNVHTLVESSENSALKSCYLQTQAWNLPDGMPIARAVRKLAQHAEKISGPDFMETFLTRFPEMPMGFIGGTPEVQKTLSQRFRLSNATFYNPPMRPFSPENAREDFEKLSVISRKNGSLPLLIWVGLGAPKQELWMQAVAKIAPQSVFLGVGAAFDFLGGRIQRAPVWMQNLGLEWFHRFLQDPRRLGPRYLRSNLRYLLKSTLD